ncbi:hypothetical protein [Caproicibacterium sp. BJN0003]|uniref:hypothetical protein n=1 Tax=Caproicibacterium sp. BJN0003 TaxID=2994078 RepID=UPI00224F382A|nr:hypothetical protein [Caproicibacterium sp. BJN0003]UZT82134.1 hypothetical protein OP489_11810 [Caproicibacterium sp. BJN0003]
MNELIDQQTACDALDDLADHYNRDLHEPIMANGIMEARAEISKMIPARNKEGNNDY